MSLVDRVQVLARLVGPLEPRVGTFTPGDPVLARQTYRRVKRVHDAAKLRPVDGVLWRATWYQHRDLGDEAGT